MNLFDEVPSNPADATIDQLGILCTNTALSLLGLTQPKTDEEFAHTLRLAGKLNASLIRTWVKAQGER
ncbi:MAG TPA: hypothetical protein VFT74_07275, partial [Isosphaeraceae bacterium]|nr:hypothetical protein [Isosphaeraceae bacterium]